MTARLPPDDRPAAAVHRIRLRGFWASAPAADGRTRHARRFGAPRALDPDERLWVVWADVMAVADVAVNGRPLGTARPGESFAADVTADLLPRNELTVDGHFPAHPLDVALEVHSRRPG